MNFLASNDISSVRTTWVIELYRGLGFLSSSKSHDCMWQIFLQPFTNFCQRHSGFKNHFLINQSFWFIFFEGFSKAFERVVKWKLKKVKNNGLMVTCASVLILLIKIRCMWCFLLSLAVDPPGVSKQQSLRTPDELLMLSVSFLIYIFCKVKL